MARWRSSIPEGGGPLASRVGVATDADGAPLILVSMLSAHTRAIMADPRCSLLLGEPGRGDPLAHPRITLVCRASETRAGHRLPMPGRRVATSTATPRPNSMSASAISICSASSPNYASLNGGFGKAYALTRADLMTGGPAVEADRRRPSSRRIDHMNKDHRDAIDLYARHFANAANDGWSITGLDADGHGHRHRATRSGASSSRSGWNPPRTCARRWWRWRRIARTP